MEPRTIPYERRTQAGSTSPMLHGVTPYLTVHGASDAAEFYKRAFGAEESCARPRTTRTGGANVALPIEDAFWGARCGQVRDPFGHTRSIGSPEKP